MQGQAVTPRPEDFIFNKPRSRYALGGEEGVSFLLASKVVDGKQVPHIDYVENYGILNYYYGVPYPAKGFVTPEAMADLNGMKRMIINDMKLATNPFILLGFVLDRNRFIANRAEVYDRVFGYHSIQSKWLCRGAYAVEAFITNITGNRFFANLIAQIPEYDDAYRYRMQDIFTELDVIAFRKNPRKELRRLKNIMKQRDRGGVFKKIEYFFKVAEVLLFIPSIRKAVCDNIHFLKIGKYDKNDHYWVCLYEHGYDYLGVDIEERCKYYKEKPYMYKVRT